MQAAKILLATYKIAFYCIMVVSKLLLHLYKDASTMNAASLIFITAHHRKILLILFRSVHVEISFKWMGFTSSQISRDNTWYTGDPKCFLEYLVIYFNTSQCNGKRQNKETGSHLPGPHLPRRIKMF